MRFIISIFFFLFFLKGVKDSEPVDGFGFTREIFVTNTNDETIKDAQVILTIDTFSLIKNGEMLGDCDDINFEYNLTSHILNNTDFSVLIEANKDISFYLEGNCNTTKTQIWVLFPFLLPGKNLLLMHYGGNEQGMYTVNTDRGNKTLEFGGNFVSMVDADYECDGGWETMEKLHQTNGDQRDYSFFPIGFDGELKETVGKYKHNHDIIIEGDVLLLKMEMEQQIYYANVGEEYCTVPRHTLEKKDYKSNITLLKDFMKDLEEVVYYPPTFSVWFCQKKKLDFFEKMLIMTNDKEITDSAEWKINSNTIDKIPSGYLKDISGSSSHSHTKINHDEKLVIQRSVSPQYIKESEEIVGDCDIVNKEIFQKMTDADGIYEDNHTILKVVGEEQTISPPFTSVVFKNHNEAYSNSMNITWDKHIIGMFLKNVEDEEIPPLGWDISFHYKHFNQSFPKGLNFFGDKNGNEIHSHPVYVFTDDNTDYYSKKHEIIEFNLLTNCGNNFVKYLCEVAVDDGMNHSSELSSSESSSIPLSKQFIFAKRFEQIDGIEISEGITSENVIECFGVKSSSEDVCGGKGSCDSKDICICTKKPGIDEDHTRTRTGIFCSDLIGNGEYVENNIIEISYNVECESIENDWLFETNDYKYFNCNKILKMDEMEKVGYDSNCYWKSSNMFETEKLVIVLDEDNPYANGNSIKNLDVISITLNQFISGIKSTWESIEKYDEEYKKTNKMQYSAFINVNISSFSDSGEGSSNSGLIFGLLIGFISFFCFIFFVLIFSIIFLVSCLICYKLKLKKFSLIKKEIDSKSLSFSYS